MWRKSRTQEVETRKAVCAVGSRAVEKSTKALWDPDCPSRAPEAGHGPLWFGICHFGVLVLARSALFLLCPHSSRLEREQLFRAVVC